ncbi:MAG: hypothetical protein ACD_58C00109G0001 [uncultured bacterium]|nr:MAG: hypothetical protein ACD_58C00109G0001 [uncultured bacterium]
MDNQDSIEIPGEVFIKLKGEQALKRTLEMTTLIENERWQSYSILPTTTQITSEQKVLAENVYLLLRAISHAIVDQATKWTLDIWNDVDRNYVLLYYIRKVKSDYAIIEMRKNGMIVLRIFSRQRISVFTREISDSEDLLHIFSTEVLESVLNNPQIVFDTIINNSKEYSKWYEKIMSSVDYQRRQKLIL